MSQKFKSKNIIVAICLLLLVLLAAGIIQAANKPSATSNNSSNQSKTTTEKDIKNFAEECLRVNQEEAKKIFNVEKVDLNLSSVSRQETVAMVQVSCPFSLIKGQTKNANLRVSFQIDKNMEEKPKRIEQLKASTKTKAPNQKNELLNDLGEVALYKEQSDISGKVTTVSLIIINDDTTYTMTYYNPERDSKLNITKDMMVQFSKKLL